MTDSREIADQKVWIRASRLVLEEMKKGWSPPVEAHVTPNADGSWEMTFRAVYNEKGEQVARRNVYSTSQGLGPEADKP